LSAVIIADVVMSLDNVVALVTTTPLVVSGAALLDRLPMLVYVVAVLGGCCGWITGRSAACR
jgi:predicted tellurium resistance membrane protein TerC